MTYFKNTNTLEELRKQYKELLKKHHPDNPNGSEDTTKAINAEYDNIFKVIKDRHEKTADRADEQTSSYDKMKWDFAEDERLREILQKIIHLSDITIEIIGNWCWIGGNSYRHKAELNKLGFKYAGQKKMWYWHSEAFRKKSHKSLDINAIRNYYGSTDVETEKRKQLKQA